VALWSRVLATVPDARLFLKCLQLQDPSVRAETLRRFEAQGIAADMLILEGPSPREEYLRAYGRVDIALDPFPYPGGTITAEALWMGVPTITLRGDRLLSHLGETIAHNAGLAGWIAPDKDAYVAMAAKRASDLGTLSALRSSMRDRIAASPLFDAGRFARHFESALWEMWNGRNT
jgi:predicted O-linked N-acetylglucosamine transferase (SPINDLY family)